MSESVTVSKELLQQALEALIHICHNTLANKGYDGQRVQNAIDNLKAALAQQKQEPVLVVEKEPDYMSRGHFYEGSKPFIDPTEVWKLPIGTKLYAHPLRREWQELTNPDIARVFRAVYGGARFGPSEKEFAIAVERALKEKNNG
jgi:hypothetical protein